MSAARALAMALSVTFSASGGRPPLAFLCTFVSAMIPARVSVNADVGVVGGALRAVDVPPRRGGGSETCFLISVTTKFSAELWRSASFLADSKGEKYQYNRAPA